MAHTSVEIVNPGGTGRPALVISARPDPFPPSVSFIVRSPSALPLPKKYTYFFGFARETWDVTRRAGFLCAMNETTPIRNRRLYVYRVKISALDLGLCASILSSETI